MSLNKLNKKKILILDCEDLKIFLKKKKYNCFFYSFKNIKYLILLKSIFNSILTFTNIKTNYFKNIIKFYNPSIVIGNDITLRAVKVKTLFPKIICITYQFSYIADDTRYKKFSNQEKLLTDYFFCFSKIEMNFIKKYFKANFIVNGSLRNNIANIKKKIKNTKRIVNYVSEFHINPRTDFMIFEKKKLEILEKYCQKKKLNLHITLRSNRLDKKINSDLELNYFRKILKKNFYTYNYDSYNIAKNSLITVSGHSNLGFELVSRGEKVLFLPEKKKVLENLYFKKIDSEILDTSNNFKIIEKKLNFLISLKKKNFLKLAKKNLYVIPYEKINFPLNFNKINSL